MFFCIISTGRSGSAADLEARGVRGGGAADDDDDKFCLRSVRVTIGEAGANTTLVASVSSRKDSSTSLSNALCLMIIAA
jgi:hypothetical protein